MITLIATTLNDAPVTDLSASFDELGGTIGRAPNNQLVLPDPARVVSRVHARVIFRGGLYYLVACGGNALVHNDKTIKNGAEVVMTEGDRIQMGSYCLIVSTQKTALAIDPFEAMFKAEDQQRAQSYNQQSGDLITTPPLTLNALPSSRAAAPPKRAGAESGIPDDWDPFDSLCESNSHAPFGQVQVDEGNSQQEVSLPRPAAEESLDELFGLGSSFSDKPSRKGSATQPDTREQQDPFRSLQKPSTPVAKTEPDHVSDMNSPWNDGPRVFKQGLAKNPQTLPGAVLSWDSKNRDTAGHAEALQARPGLAQPSTGGTTSEHGMNQFDAAREVRGVRGAGQAIPAPSHSSNRLDANGQPQDDLLDALLDGLGAPDLRIEQLTPELMRQLGQLLRESTKGTVELLAIRAALKREIRAEVTVIHAKENNSLKFSPNVDVALRHILSPKMGGFMPPVESMRDAFEDLRAHELAVMAGMKAALAGVLQRFDPTALEVRLTRQSPLAGLIPSARKAKLWNLFEGLYKQLASDAQDDFDTLFGKAFVKAYEHYLEELVDSGSTRRPK